MPQSVLAVALQLEGGLSLCVIGKLFRDNQQRQRLLGLGHERLQTLSALVQLLGECLFFQE
jgi:hypothetical protein